MFTGKAVVVKRLERVRGKVRYELKNFRGDIRQVISDIKYREEVNGVVEYTPDVWQVEDSYPFGWSIKDRSFTHPNPEESYRFGFNGKENDKSFGNQLIQDYGFRLYNPAIAKFLSVDPLAPEYPELTTYQFASNSPIANIDRDGLESEPATFDYPTGTVINSTVDNAPNRIQIIPPTKSTTTFSRPMEYVYQTRLIGPAGNGPMTAGTAKVLYYAGKYYVQHQYQSAYELKKGIQEGDIMVIAGGASDLLWWQKDMLKSAGKDVYDGIAGILKKSDCGCFIAGTTVKAREGDKNIEEIEVGDWV